MNATGTPKTTGHCEDAVIERETRKLIDLRLASSLATVQPRPLMADVPPALRGPRWQGRR